MYFCMKKEYPHDDDRNIEFYTYDIDTPEKMQFVCNVLYPNETEPWLYYTEKQILADMRKELLREINEMDKQIWQKVIKNFMV